MAVFTISSLTLTGNKSDFVRGARSQGEQKLLAAAKCGDRAAFDSRSSFSSWLTSIAINSALMIRRKKRNSFEVSTDGSGNPDVIDRHWEAVDRAPNLEKHCLQKEREGILRRAIRTLRPSIRGVVEMQQLQEHSMRETARMTGITVAAAKARLFHARAALRKDSGLKTIARTTLNSERS